MTSITLLSTIPLLLSLSVNGILFMDHDGNFLRIGPGEERVLVEGNICAGQLPTTPLWDVLVDTTGSVTRLYVCAGLAFASQHGGVFVSDLDGVDWDSLSSAFPNDFVLSLGQDRSTPEILLAGTDGDGMYRTTDAGMNWNSVHPSQKTRHITFDEQDPSVVYSGNEGTGVFKSTDAGVSWFASNAGISLVNATGVAVDQADSNHIYVIWQALNSGGVFYTTDAGGTWVPAPNLPSQRQTGMALDPTDGNIVYVCNSGPWNAGMDDGVYKSTDGGNTWTNNFGFPDTAELSAVEVAPSDPSIVFTGGNKWLQPFGTRIWKSTDAGGTWSLVYDNPATQFVAIVSIAIDPFDPLTAYAGARANGSTVLGVLKTTDGGSTWTEANSGLSNLSILGLAIDPADGSRIMAATAGGMFVSFDEAANWSPTDSLGYASSVALRPDSIAYAGTPSSGVFRSTDFGATWVEFGSGMPSSRTVNDLAVDLSRPHRVTAALSDIGAYAVVDTGAASWVCIGPSGGDVNWIEIVPASHQTLYAATQSGVFKSTDGGALWERCTDGPQSEIHVVRASPGGDTIHVGTTGYYRSTDAGSTWTDIGLPTLPYEEVTAISVDPLDSDILYLGIGSYLSGSYCHVLKSTDGGTSWEFKCGGLPFSNSMEVSSIGVNPMNNLKLYATFGSGFFGTSDFYVSVDGGETWTHPVGADEESAPAREANLALAVRPNPFSRSVEIQIPGGQDRGPAWAELVISDVAGRTVRTFRAEELRSRYLRWDGVSASGEILASGVYFLRLNSGDEPLVGKAILVR